MTTEILSNELTRSMVHKQPHTGIAWFSVASIVGSESFPLKQLRFYCGVHLTPHFPSWKSPILYRTSKDRKRQLSSWYHRCTCHMRFNPPAWFWSPSSLSGQTSSDVIYIGIFHIKIVSKAIGILAHKIQHLPPARDWLRFWLRSCFSAGGAGHPHDRNSGCNEDKQSGGHAP